MTKWKDKTKGGHKILWREEIKEGERKGWSCGVVDTKESEDSCIWTPNGREIGTAYYNLVPAEPEVTHDIWVNIYGPTVSTFYTITETKTPIVSHEGGVLGRLHIAWLSDGSYTVTKEEV